MNPAVRESVKRQGAILRAARRRAGLSQAELTRALQPLITTQANISNYEAGKREMPLNIACEIAFVLDIDLRELAEADITYLVELESGAS